jgi:hypothetical protein
MRDRLPTSQAAVSRYERGEGGLPPTRHLVTSWLEICEVSDEATRDRVLALVEAAHNESRSWLGTIYARLITGDPQQPTVNLTRYLRVVRRLMRHVPVTPARCRPMIGLQD